MSINTFDFLYLPRGAFIKFKGRRARSRKEKEHNNKIKAQRPKINEMANSLAKQLLLGNKENGEKAAKAQSEWGEIHCRIYFCCTSSEFLRKIFFLLLLLLLALECLKSTMSEWARDGERIGDSSCSPY